MVNLILVTLSIALVALVLVGGISYVSHDAGGRMIATNDIRTGFVVMQNGFSAYRTSNQGSWPLPGTLPSADSAEIWESEMADFVPGHVFPDIDGFAWSYGLDSDSGARILCLHPTDASQSEAIRRALEVVAGATDASLVSPDDCVTPDGDGTVLALSVIMSE